MQKNSKTYVVSTIGCRTNQYEAEAFKSQLLALGYRPAEEGQKADLCLIHTCAVTEHAESSSRHEIRSLISRHEGSRVVVTGCLARKKNTSLASIEGVTDVVSNELTEEIIQQLFPEEAVAPPSITHFDGHTRAFIKVQDGCNHFCSYCTVPLLRGRSRSRSLNAIVDEVHALIHSGYQEIVLTGVNVGDYVDGGHSLADLVHTIDEIKGVKRLRLSSINPNEIDGALFEAITTGRSTCPSMHLVLQSGSNDVLQRMRRLYTREQYMDIVSRFRDRCPDFTVTTDVIVGFPGETEADFLETLDVIKRVRCAKVHMFPFSERPQTQAARCANKISPDLIKARKMRVLDLADSVAFDFRQPFVGRVMDVLTESGEVGDYIQGQTFNGLPVLLPKIDRSPNQILRVKLDSNGTCGFVGSVLEVLS